MLRDDDLLHGDPSEVASFLGITPRQFRNYRTGKTPLPEAHKKLLRLRLEGDLRALGGDAWAGFYLQQGKLYMPMWERPVPPENLRAMFFQVQEVAALRADLKQLRAELWALKKVHALKDPAPAVPKFDRRKA